MRRKTISIFIIGLFILLLGYCYNNEIKSSAEECTKKENIVLCDTSGNRDTNIENYVRQVSTCFINNDYVY